MFKSIGHMFATFYQKLTSTLPKIQAQEQTVETVTAAIPTYGPLAIPFEKLGFMLMGELSAVLAAGGDAAKAKLADAGLDVKVIETVQDAYQKTASQIAVLAK